MNEMTDGRVRTLGEDDDKARKERPQQQEETATFNQSSKATTAYANALRNQFLIVGKNYYYRDGSEFIAFNDRGEKLTTDVHDPQVIRGMILLAQEKGWTSIHVRGSDEFKAEAWLQARMAGLSVHGYEPRALDEAILADRLRERSPRADTVRTQTTRTDTARVQGQTGPTQEPPLTEKQTLALNTLNAILKDRGDSPAMQAAVLREATTRLQGERIVTGTVLEHGLDHYAHHKDHDKSYFVKLQTPDGVREVWGRDLARAFEQSAIKTGDRVALVQKGRDPVVVPVAIRDEQGRVMERISQSAYRNTWDVLNFEQVGRRDQPVGERSAVPVGKEPLVPVYDPTAPRRSTETVTHKTAEQERVREGR